MILPSQRHLFDLPRDVAYLNCAYMSPLMHEVAAAGEAGVLLKMQPWRITPEDFFTRSEHNRALFARLINAAPDDIAIVPAVSYGMAVAARNLPLAKGEEIVLLQDQFPSNVYPWRRLARDRHATVRMISRQEAAIGNAAQDWTAALLNVITERSAIVALPHCHWTDGALIDLAAVSARARECGAALVLDITQSGGALPINVAEIQPDFLVCASYKWLCGPYTYGFLYAAPKWQQGEPLEENWIGREGSQDFRRLVDYQDGYQPGARRYDMGERSSFHLAPMAEAGLTRLLGWEVANIAETLAARTGAIAARAAALGLETLPESLRAPHYLGLRVPGGVPDELPARFGAQNVFVSVRGESIRVTPHLYNDDADSDRLFDVLERTL